MKKSAKDHEITNNKMWTKELTHLTDKNQKDCIVSFYEENLIVFYCRSLIAYNEKQSLPVMSYVITTWYKRIRDLSFEYNIINVYSTNMVDNESKFF